MTELPKEVIERMAPQLRLVYDFLMSGRYLSGLIAMTTLRTQNLTTRIAELRKLGLQVEGEWASDFGDTRYKRYWVEVADLAARKAVEGAT